MWILRNHLYIMLSCSMVRDGWIINELHLVTEIGNSLFVIYKYVNMFKCTNFRKCSVQNVSPADMCAIIVTSAKDECDRMAHFQRVLGLCSRGGWRVRWTVFALYLSSHVHLHYWWMCLLLFAWCKVSKLKCIKLYCYCTLYKYIYWLDIILFKK